MERCRSNPDGSVSAIAPAKINLFLHITGRRANGFHELESLFAFTQTGDLITVEPADELSLAIEGSFAASLRDAGGDGSGNLVCKSASALAEFVERKPSVRITLKKELPIASGIGGGSSDAAATLLALCKLWDVQIREEELAEIALRLGADVPACLHQYPLYVRGIGEEIYRKSLPKQYGILLLNPLISISTPNIFTTFKNDPANGFDAPLGAEFSWPSQDANFVSFLKNDVRNALQSPAQEICGDVTDVLKSLGNLPNILHVGMSGSGATCFALFDNQNQAELALEKVKSKKPDWWCKADSLIHTE